jgi:hypothetical protein
MDGTGRLARFARTFWWLNLGLLAAYFTTTYLFVYFEQSNAELLAVHIAAVAIALAGAFWVASRPSDRAGEVVRAGAELVIRIFLAYMMLFYGSAKLLPGGQFAQPPLVEMDKPYYLLSPFWKAWGFFAHSAAYNVFLACGELAAGILLLFERTKRLAVCMLIPILANVVLVNYAFGINVLYIASLLLVMAVTLLAAERRWLIASFWSHEPFPSAPAGLPLGRPLGYARVLLAAAFVVQTAYVLYRYPAPERPVLYGIWSVERSSIASVLPVSAKLYCDEDDQSHLAVAGALQELRLAIDPARRTVSIGTAKGAIFAGTYTVRAKGLLLADRAGTCVELRRVY